MSDITDSIDAVIDQLPATFATRGRGTNIMSLIQETGPLTDEHVAAAREFVASGRSLGITTPNIKAIRNTHHRLAQLLAAGMADVDAARLSGFNPNRVAHLRRDPAFQELLSHYAGVAQEEFRDFVTAAAELSQDFLEELQRRLDENPDSFTPTALLEAIKTLADRSGNAPVAKSVSVNVTSNLGDRMAKARARLAEGTAQ